MGLPPSVLLHYRPHFMSFAAKSYYRNLRYYRKRAILGLFLPNLGQMRFFSKNPALSLLCLYGPLTSCKISEKIMSQFREKRVTHEWTNRRHWIHRTIWRNVVENEYLWIFISLLCWSESYREKWPYWKSVNHYSSEFPPFQIIFAQFQLEAISLDYRLTQWLL